LGSRRPRLGRGESGDVDRSADRLRSWNVHANARRNVPSRQAAARTGAQSRLMGDEGRFYEANIAGARRSAPAALRNREPIAEVLAEWLPASGIVLEIASGTGEHAIYFAERFPSLEWQPSDVHLDALDSIDAWRRESGL